MEKAVKGKEKEVRFSVIVTHLRPHLDEIIAIWLLKLFGETKFPGVSEAGVVFYGQGSDCKEDLAELEKEGAVFVGVGGGMFDEHAVNGEEKRNECAATLVAKFLGVDKNPALKVILELAFKFDTKAVGGPFDLPTLVKKMHVRYPDDPEEVMNWAIKGLEALYDEQNAFQAKSLEQEYKEAHVEIVKGPGGKNIKIVTCVTSNELFNRYARKKGNDAGVVIQKQPIGPDGKGGNVQIFTDQIKSRLKINDAVVIIRLWEQMKKGKVEVSDWKKLASAGKLKEVPEWFYHEEGQMILNGSLTADDIPPTKLSLEEIRQAVKMAICPDIFCPDPSLENPRRERSYYCRQGICTSTYKKPCSWYRYGLTRCRAIRWRMANQ